MIVLRSYKVFFFWGGGGFDLLFDGQLQGVAGVLDVILTVRMIGICHVMVADFEYQIPGRQGSISHTSGYYLWERMRRP